MSDKNSTIKEMLKDINTKIEHIEDIGADNRAVIIKLVKQNNQIVEFLKQLELHEVSDDDFMFENELNIKETKSEKGLKLKELLEQYKDKSKDLQELEKELKKNKDQIVPGQIGEA